MAQTADACAALGVPVPRTTITNLELGRRASVDLAEFLVLARALGVPPITLLFPLGKAATVELLPGQPVSTWEALAWFTGEAHADTPASEGSAQHLLDTFRAHSDAVATAAASTRLATERRRKATSVPESARRAALLEAAASYEELAAEDRRELRAVPGLPQQGQEAHGPTNVSALRQAGLSAGRSPALTAYLTHVLDDCGFPPRMIRVNPLGPQARRGRVRDGPAGHTDLSRRPRR